MCLKKQIVVDLAHLCDIITHNHFLVNCAPNCLSNGRIISWTESSASKRLVSQELGVL